jgi:hypothetical protein
MLDRLLDQAPPVSTLWRDEILPEIQRIVSFIGLKQAAFDLDAKPSALSHALAERERHYVRAEWIPYFLAKAPDDALADKLAAIRGLETARPAALTPEQKLNKIEQALERMPAGIAAAIWKEAGLK